MVEKCLLNLTWLRSETSNFEPSAESRSRLSNPYMFLHGISECDIYIHLLCLFTLRFSVNFASQDVFVMYPYRFVVGLKLLQL